MTVVKDAAIDGALTNSAIELDAPPAAPAKKSFGWSSIIGPVILFGVFLAFWEYMHRHGMRDWLDKNPKLLPSPATVVDKGFMNDLIRGKLIEGLGWTVYASMVGLGITIVFGMTLAVLMAQARWVERSVYPYLVALQATPVLAIVPLIYIVFGGGMSSRIYVCVMISIFPIVTNTLFGLTSVDSTQHDLFTLRNASTFTRMRKLQFPAAMPAIFTGFRISAGLAVIGAIVGEQFFRQGQKPGLGVVVEQLRPRAQYPGVFAAVITACLLGIAIFFAFGFISRLIVGHWYEDTRRRK